MAALAAATLTVVFKSVGADGLGRKHMLEEKCVWRCTRAVLIVTIADTCTSLSRVQTWNLTLFVSGFGALANPRGHTFSALKRKRDCCISLTTLASSTGSAWLRASSCAMRASTAGMFKCSESGAARRAVDEICLYI